MILLTVHINEIFRVVYYFCGSMSLCKNRTVQCYECIGCPASELIGCNIFFLHR